MLAVIVGGIVLIGVVVASLASSWTVAQRDPKSPEGVIQAYLTAVFDHDPDAAFALLEADTACTVANFQQVYYDNSARVDLVDSSVSGDNADVHVRLEHGNGDPFDGRWTEEQYFQLVREAGGWRIHGMPWPVYQCGAAVK